ncbi:ABC transporter substrate-binding protein [Aeromicrobium sp. CTD01-1L150]|uniref:ABC transporter substrate-binding protein n=1 Tax=Aeromicrobium sp. CTD01-1L150 TaxID=3341830 RepID=UPI0035C24FFD
MTLRPTLLAALLVLCLTAACGGGSSAEDSADSETRTVESPFTGEQVEIPTEPERVVALWRTGAVLVDVGVEPVAALEGELIPEELVPDVYATVDDVPTVGTFEGVDIERLIEADPDLIIGMDHGGLELDYEEISEVAPTVVLDIAEPTDVWENYPQVADLVGRTTDFEQADAELDDALAGIKDEFGEDLGDLEATAFGVSENAIWVDTSKALSYQRIVAAGFGYNEEYTDDPERYVDELSQENIASLADQDVIFYDVGIDGEPAAETQAILDTASFKRLPAAQAGHVFPLTSGTNYTFEGAQLQVDDLRAAATELSPTS